MAVVGITIWNGRVSPVFESAGRILKVDIENGREAARSEHDLPAFPGQRHTLGRFDRIYLNAFSGNCAFKRVEKLRELELDFLVCGAISECVARLVESTGIMVVGWISGEVEDVIKGVINDRIYDPGFLMPGCGGRGRRRRRSLNGRGRGMGRNRGKPEENITMKLKMRGYPYEGQKRKN